MVKYSKKAQDKVEKTMHEMKEGTLKSGSGDKVTSKEQAIAIGLSEARKEGAKVPQKKESTASATKSTKKALSKKTGATKSAAKKSPMKKMAAKKTSAKKSAAKKSAAKKGSVKKGAAKKSSAKKTTSLPAGKSGKKSATKKSGRSK